MDKQHQRRVAVAVGGGVEIKLLVGLWCQAVVFIGIDTKSVTSSPDPLPLP